MHSVVSIIRKFFRVEKQHVAAHRHDSDGDSSAGRLIGRELNMVPMYTADYRGRHPRHPGASHA